MTEAGLENQHGLPEELVPSDPAQLADKLELFASDGPDALHLLLDFDRTVTIGKPGEDDATIWQVLQRHLPPEGQQRYSEFYQHYRKLELAGTMTEIDAQNWWGGILGLFAEYGVQLRDVENNFLDVVQMRPGAVELFTTCETQHIPVVILSAGIKDVIDLLLAKSGIKSTITVSTELELDDSGAISGWDKSTLVHVLNKHEAAHPELDAIRRSRPNCLLAGDNLDDAAMAEGTERVLRVRIVDPRPDETTASGEIERQTFQRFDALIASQTLLPLVSLVRQIQNSRNNG